MMHEQIKWHDACPNVVQLSLNSQNWLEHRVSNTKTPKFLKNHLIIIQDRLQKIMTNYIKSTSQFHQFIQI